MHDQWATHLEYIFAVVIAAIGWFTVSFVPLKKAAKNAAMDALIINRAVDVIGKQKEVQEQSLRFFGASERELIGLLRKAIKALNCSEEKHSARSLDHNLADLINTRNSKAEKLNTMFADQSKLLVELLSLIGEDLSEEQTNWRERNEQIALYANENKTKDYKTLDV